MRIESSACVRSRVLRARDIQLERYRPKKNIYANSQMPPKLIRKHCAITAEGEKIPETATQRLGLSARAHDRILKVSRTIADLEGAPSTAPKHPSEAIQYRTLDQHLLGVVVSISRRTGWSFRTDSWIAPHSACE
jgi:magnesium chelatase family protein